MVTTAITRAADDLLLLEDVSPAERAAQVTKMLGTGAAETSVEDLLELLRPEFELDPEQLEELYFVAGPKMQRKEYPVLSETGKSLLPAIAGTALRLLGRAGNQDAATVLLQRLTDRNPDIAVAAADGLGLLADPKTSARLVALAAELKPVLTRDGPPEQRVTDAHIPAAAALALAYLGQFKQFGAWLSYAGRVNEMRLEKVYQATRSQYNAPDQIRVALADARRAKQRLRHVRLGFRELWQQQPAKVVAAVAQCADGYALDLAYGALHSALSKDNAHDNVHVLQSNSAELKSLYIDLAWDWLDASDRETVITVIRAAANSANNPQQRRFACAYCHLLSDPECIEMLSKLLRDPSAWVRRNAVLKARATNAESLDSTVRDLASADPDVMVRTAAQNACP